MSRVELAPEVGDDLERIVDHLLSHQGVDAPARIEDIIRAIDVLERNPLIGRPARAGLRELVIGRRAHGSYFPHIGRRLNANFPAGPAGAQA